MKCIRTEKNKYNIDIIIDICENLQFIESSGLEWIEIADELTPNLGDYFYDGKVISLASDDYKIIEDIIFNAEEPNRIEREKNLPPITEEEILEESTNEDEENLPDSNNPEQAIPDVLNLPKPKLYDLSDVESTIENYESWKTNLSDMDVTLSACDSGNYVVEDNEVVFNPPLQFSDGRIEERVILPLSLSVEEQIQHLKDQREQIVILLDRIKTDLQITD